MRIFHVGCEVGTECGKKEVDGSGVGHRASPMEDGVAVIIDSSSDINARQRLGWG